VTDADLVASLQHAVETAPEDAALRLLADLSAAVAEVKPSPSAWFDTARNVALFANEGGLYDDLVGYLRKHRMP
jgi:hypothetical protein